MPDPLTRIALARLCAQRVHGESASSLVEVVRLLRAMQAQDLPSAKWAVALRSREADLADVDRALNSGDIVRAWPMRGTLHLVAAEDLGWMLSLTAERMTAAAKTRYRQLGLTDEVFASARTIAESQLSGGRTLSRREFLASLDEAGIVTKGRGSHLIGQLTISGVLCLGPMEDPNAASGVSGQRIALAEEWIASPRRLSRDEALTELLVRYVTGHGPATLQDFTWWTKLTLSDARVAVDAAGELIVPVTIGQTQYLCSPATAHTLESLDDPPAEALDLLPGFDEFLLGFRDRSAALPARHADRVVPGSNGMFLPTVVQNGRVTGTWSRSIGSDGVSVEVSVFPGECAPSLEDVQDAGRRYADYLGAAFAGARIAAG